MAKKAEPKRKRGRPRGSKNKKPKEPTLISVFIKSEGTDAHTEFAPDGEKFKYIYGSVNGVPFKIPCDRQAEVTPEVAEALRGLIMQQQRG